MGPTLRFGARAHVRVDARTCRLSWCVQTHMDGMSARARERTERKEEEEGTGKEKKGREGRMGKMQDAEGDNMKLHDCPQQ